jgi:hypothetical protein
MELVLQYFVFALLSYLFLLLEFLVAFFEIVINVTRIVTASTTVMLAPFAKTKPAEAKLALLASHVHTALVLFNQACTLWTWLGIGLDPREILTITALLFFPDTHHGAGCW